MHLELVLHETRFSVGSTLALEQPLYCKMSSAIGEYYFWYDQCHVCSLICNSLKIVKMVFVGLSLLMNENPDF
jgi:hypothetical protein